MCAMEQCFIGVIILSARTGRSKCHLNVSDEIHGTLLCAESTFQSSAGGISQIKIDFPTKKRLFGEFDFPNSHCLRLTVSSDRHLNTFLHRTRAVDLNNPPLEVTEGFLQSQYKQHNPVKRLLLCVAS